MSSAQEQSPKEVTIIGAGLAGLTLALALHDNNIKATIYELRGDSYNMGGAIMLSPNALRVLDHVGKPESVYQRVHSKGYDFDTLSFVNENHELSDVYYFGQEEIYGYSGFRIYRQVLLEELVAMCKERNIPIHYGRGFSKIVHEDADSVTFAMTDGEEIKTEMLIGADGIHSTVRKYLSDAIPKFGGALGVTGHIPTSSLRLPPNYPLPVTVQGKKGAFVMAPQNADGSEMFIGVQRPHEALDREGWARLTQNKARLHEMMLENKDDWNDVVQSAMEAIRPEDMTIWPFHQLPTLETWKSQFGRVVIIGDAAHAIPPIAGQGVNQAFEDAYTLTVLLAGLGSKGVTLMRALDFWQQWRQARIEKVHELTRLMGNKRLPEAERLQIDNTPTGDKGQLAWLYAPKLDEEMSAWIKKQGEEVEAKA